MFHFICKIWDPVICFSLDICTDPIIWNCDLGEIQSDFKDVYKHVEVFIKSQFRILSTQIFST